MVVHMLPAHRHSPSRQHSPARSDRHGHGKFKHDRRNKKHKRGRCADRNHVKGMRARALAPDIMSAPDKFVVTFMAPGVAEGDLEFDKTLADRITVRGTSGLYSVEQPFMLPANADVEHASLCSVDGIVSVIVPKKETDATDQEAENMVQTMKAMEMHSGSETSSDTSSMTSSEHVSHASHRHSTKAKGGCGKGKRGKSGGHGKGKDKRGHGKRNGICKGKGKKGRGRGHRRGRHGSDDSSSDSDSDSDSSSDSDDSRDGSPEGRRGKGKDKRKKGKGKKCHGRGGRDGHHDSDSDSDSESEPDDGRAGPLKSLVQQAMEQSADQA